MTTWASILVCHRSPFSWFNQPNRLTYVNARTQTDRTPLRLPVFVLGYEKSLDLFKLETGHEFTGNSHHLQEHNHDRDRYHQHHRSRLKSSATATVPHQVLHYNRKNNYTWRSGCEPAPLWKWKHSVVANTNKAQFNCSGTLFPVILTRRKTRRQLPMMFIRFHNVRYPRPTGWQVFLTPATNTWYIILTQVRRTFSYPVASSCLLTSMLHVSLHHYLFLTGSQKNFVWHFSAKSSQWGVSGSTVNWLLGTDRDFLIVRCCNALIAFSDEATLDVVEAETEVKSAMSEKRLNNLLQNYSSTHSLVDGTRDQLMIGGCCEHNTGIVEHCRP